MRKFGLLIMLVCGLHCAKAQDAVPDYLCDTLTKQPSYWVFKGDTLNRTSAEGKKAGTWKTFIACTIVTTTINDVEIRNEYFRADWHGQYENDLKTGTWKRYFDNGREYMVAHYEDGLVAGEIKIYGNKGELRFEAHVVKGSDTADLIVYYEGKETGRVNVSVKKILEVSFL